MTVSSNRTGQEERRGRTGGPEKEKTASGKRSRVSLSLREDGEILFSSRGRGLRPLLKCAGLWPGPAPGRILTDRVTGIAAARVIAAARLAGRVEAGVISREAIGHLERRSIAAVGKETIETVFRRNGSDPCPLEELSRRHRSDREFLLALYRSFSLELPPFIFRIPDRPE